MHLNEGRCALLRSSASFSFLHLEGASLRACKTAPGGELAQGGHRARARRQGGCNAVDEHGLDMGTADGAEAERNGHPQQACARICQLLSYKVDF